MVKKEKKRKNKLRQVHKSMRFHEFTVIILIKIKGKKEKRKDNKLIPGM